MKSARRNVLLIVIFINLIASVLSNQIFSIHGGGGFGRSSHEPKYKIEFHEPHSPFHPGDDQESMVMSDKNGQKFSCFLPKEDKTKTSKFVPQQNTSSLIVETQRKVTLKTPDELLEVFKDKCLYRQEGWWSYEFCYQNKFRQLHLEGDKVVQEFILGVYDEEATTAFNQNLSDVSILKDPHSKDASQRYHAHQYTNGTSCDLTNRPRETEVRFVCSEPNAVIASITELSTCKYALTVHSPMLCKHPMYKEQRPVWRTVNCNKTPKDSKPMGTEDGSSKDKQITMVTDVKVPSSHDSEKYET